MRFVTGMFLAILFTDLSASMMHVGFSDGFEPPQGIRRMIDTLDNNARSAVCRTVEGTQRHHATSQAA